MVTQSGLIPTLSEQDLRFAVRRGCGRVRNWWGHLSWFFERDVVGQDKVCHHALEFVCGEETSGAVSMLIRYLAHIVYRRLTMRAFQDQTASTPCLCSPSGALSLLRSHLACWRTAMDRIPRDCRSIRPHDVSSGSRCKHSYP